MKEKQLERKSQVRFPPDVFQAMHALAQAHQRSFNGEIIWALRSYIAQQQKEMPRAD